MIPANHGPGHGWSQIAYRDLGMAEENLGHVGQAYDDYRQSLASQPDFSPAVQALKSFKVLGGDTASDTVR